MVTRRRLIMWSVPALVLLLALIGLMWGVARWRSQQFADLPLQLVVERARAAAYEAPLTVRTTVAWTKVPTQVTPAEVRSDPTLWRRMLFNDWDLVPADLRRAGLQRLWNAYRHVLCQPGTWDAMTVHDWDWIPQPIRAVAYTQMVRYWSGFYHVGAEFALPRGVVTETLIAIVMSESWFEHRAVNATVSGNTDLGLAQASDYTRASLARLRAAGTIDFAPAKDEDYFDPWQASRVVAVWFGIMLDEVGGDLATAIRAYHRGGPSARAGEGQEYLDAVRRRRSRYLRPGGHSPTWEYLRRLAACRAVDEARRVPGR